MSHAAELKQLRRAAILRQLEEAHPSRVALPSIRLGLKLVGHEPTDGQLLNDLDALDADGLITRQADPLSPAHKTYAITDKGIDQL